MQSSKRRREPFSSVLSAWTQNGHTRRRTQCLCLHHQSVPPFLISAFPRRSLLSIYHTRTILPNGSAFSPPLSPVRSTVPFSHSYRSTSVHSCFSSGNSSQKPPSALYPLELLDPASHPVYQFRCFQCCLTASLRFPHQTPQISHLGTAADCERLQDKDIILQRDQKGLFKCDWQQLNHGMHISTRRRSLWGYDHIANFQNRRRGQKSVPSGAVHVHFRRRNTVTFRIRQW